MLSLEPFSARSAEYPSTRSCLRFSPVDDQLKVKVSGPVVDEVEVWTEEQSHHPRRRRVSEGIGGVPKERGRALSVEQSRAVPWQNRASRPRVGNERERRTRR